MLTPFFSSANCNSFVNRSPAKVLFTIAVQFVSDLVRFRFRFQFLFSFSWTNYQDALNLRNILILLLTKSLTFLEYVAIINWNTRSNPSTRVKYKWCCLSWRKITTSQLLIVIMNTSKEGYEVRTAFLETNKAGILYFSNISSVSFSRSAFVLNEASAIKIGCSAGFNRNCTENKCSHSCSKTSQFFTFKNNGN